MAGEGENIITLWATPVPGGAIKYPEKVEYLKHKNLFLWRFSPEPRMNSSKLKV